MYAIAWQSVLAIRGSANSADRSDMEAILTHIGAAMLGAIFGFFLAALLAISGRESEREVMKDIPDDAKGNER